MIEIFLENLLSPTILFFILGLIAGYLKSDLTVPESMGRYLSTYIMMAIGFKGGVSVSEIEVFSGQIFITICSGIIISFTIPFIAYFLLNLTTKLDKPTASALAAHYGSVSIVTFATAINFIQSKSLEYSGFLASILALMEAPAIVSGLYIAHKFAPETDHHKREEKILAKEIFTNGAVLLILGSFFVGMISGINGLNKISSFIVDPFQGILCMFMLDMGLIVTKNIQNLKSISIKLIIFGIYMPLIGASLGLITSWGVGLNRADSLLFTILCASSSYIAVPAAMRLALPEAKPSIYIPISLGVTFPVNIILGIPLYFALTTIWL